MDLPSARSVDMNFIVFNSSNTTTTRIAEYPTSKKSRPCRNTIMSALHLVLSFIPGVIYNDWVCFTHVFHISIGQAGSLDR